MRTYKMARRYRTSLLLHTTQCMMISSIILLGSSCLLLCCLNSPAEKPRDICNVELVCIEHEKVGATHVAAHLVAESSRFVCRLEFKDSQSAPQAVLAAIKLRTTPFTSRTREAKDL